MMVNLVNYASLWLLIILCYYACISTVAVEVDLKNDTLTLNQTKSQFKQEIENTTSHNDPVENDKIIKSTSDTLVAATDYKQPQIHLPLATKPRGFNLPKNRPQQQQKQNQTPQPAAQNYYSNYFDDLSSLGIAQSYYPFSEDSLIAKFLSQHSKQFQPRQQPFTTHDTSILGSGDFGILRGGTFYADEGQAFINEEEAGDFYYGDASNTETVSSTEGFIQKYTYPEEQFEQFKDFADLGTPADSAFSQYVVVYAAKNATNNAVTSSHRTSKPKNIFEQLQEIDKEKALELKKTRKNQTNPSVTKLKLVKTKLMKKKWVQKQPLKVLDDDPLIALS